MRATLIPWMLSVLLIPNLAGAKEPLPSAQDAEVMRAFCGKAQTIEEGQWRCEIGPSATRGPWTIEQKLPGSFSGTQATELMVRLRGKKAGQGALILLRRGVRGGWDLAAFETKSQTGWCRVAWNGARDAILCRHEQEEARREPTRLFWVTLEDKKLRVDALDPTRMVAAIKSQVEDPYPTSPEARKILDVPQLPKTRTGKSVRMVMHMNRAQINGCFAKHKIKNAPPAAVAVSLRITATGDVERAWITDSTLASSAMESCIVEVVQKWKYPPATSKEPLRTSYRFAFGALDPSSKILQPMRR